MAISRVLTAGAVGGAENHKEKEMIAAIRVVASAAILAAAGIGLAGPASAAPPPDGNYIGTVTDNGGASGFDVGNTANMRLSSCGPSCIHVQGSSWTADLHPQDTVWSGPTSSGANMWFDENTLAGGMDIDDGTHLKVQMRKA